jgi:hypothetical protein
MDVIGGFFWFFYLLICPVATLVAFFGFILKCESAIDLALRSIMAVLVLALLVGPIYTEVGLMSWWVPRVVSNFMSPTAKVDYFIWQYAAVCAAAFLVFGLAAMAIRARRMRNGEG